MITQNFEIITADGLKLRGRQWEPSGEEKAVICLVHGLGEHSGRYEHVADAFTREGFALFACDLRGHGKSEGKRSHAPSYALLMSDIFQGLEKAKQLYPDQPLFLYGHSLGGNLVIQYVLRKQSDIVRTYRDDPLVHDRVSLRLAKNMLMADEWNRTHAADIPCPLLLMHGEANRITSAQATREFAATANDLCTVKLWPGLYHELHNEPQQQVLTRISSWIKLTLATSRY